MVVVVVVVVRILEGSYRNPVTLALRSRTSADTSGRELGSILLTLSGLLRGSSFLDLITAILLKMEGEYQGQMRAMTSDAQEN
jgi:hypothetical protein